MALTKHAALNDNVVNKRLTKHTSNSEDNCSIIHIYIYITAHVGLRQREEGTYQYGPETKLAAVACVLSILAIGSICLQFHSAWLPLHTN